MFKFSSTPVDMIPQHMTNNACIPSTREEILNMDYMVLKILMKYNMTFYNAAIILLDREIAKQIAEMRSWEDEEELRNVQNLEDLLRNTGYFGNDYEESRKEFVTMFLDSLWDLAEEP